MPRLVIPRFSRRLLCTVILVIAQTAFSQTSSLPLTKSDTQGTTLPPATPLTRLDFQADPAPTGGDTFDVVVDNPQVIITLITPAGIEIGPGNAASQGFNYSILPAMSSPTFSVFSAPGTHTVITLPAGAQPGLYGVKADSTNATTISLLSASYYSSGGVRVALTTANSSYRVSDPIVLNAIILDGATPVVGASGSVLVATPVQLTQMTVGNYQLISQQAVDAATAQFTYSANLVNSGAAVQGVTATVTSLSADVIVIAGTLAFGDVAAAGTAPSLNTFILQRSVAATFDPNVLSWAMQSPATPVSVPLLDSGPADFATGDGVYTAVFGPAAPGQYDAVLVVSGISPSGVAFSRKALTSFTVNAPAATFVSFQDQPVTNGSGAISGLVTSATVNVDAAGTYQFVVGLQAANGNTLPGQVTAALTSGTQQLAVTFAAQDILSFLGDGGPFQRTNAVLLQQNPAGLTVVDTRIDAGATTALSLSSFDRGPIYFTGINSATGVVSDGGATFDILRVQIGIFNPAGDCDWNGILSSAAGTGIDFVSDSATLAAGNNTLTLDFSGYLIAQSGLNGPLTIRDVTVTCGGAQTRSGQLFQTQSFLASQFRFAAQNIGVSVDQPAQTVAAGGSKDSMVTVTPLAGFRGVSSVGVTGTPSGVTTSFWPDNRISNLGTTTLTLSALATVPAGSYPLTLTATSGALTSTAPIALTVTQPDFSVSVSPTSQAVPPGSQSASTVTVAGLNGFSSTVALSVSGAPAAAVVNLPSTVTPPAAPSLFINLDPATPSGQYPITITGVSGALVRTTTLTLTVDPTAIPSPWSAQGIGTGSAGASATHSNGVFSISAPGNSLSATADSFEFVSQPLTGDGTMIARIARLANATGASRVGIMVRETLDPAATNVFAGLTANSSLLLQSRTAPAGQYTQTTGPAQTAPVWLKLTRASNLFTAFTSPDGVRWTQLGTPVTVTMAASVYAGFALCSDSTGPVATADFDHALAASGPAFYLSDAQPAARNAVQTGATATYAVSVIPVNAFTGLVTLSASGLPPQVTAAFSSPTIAGSGGSLLTLTTSGATAGSYPITITGSSGSAVSRSVVSLVVVTSPVGTLPDPWTDQAVGGSGAGTATSFSGGVYTVTGPGLEDPNIYL